ncbi:hypothetical protein GBAR_LOCUS11745 [Geodia barretti]|uniref:Uncharacterized protein n=1 Tax=Geodia barretti TaxID=519541 RepID=A0AA35RXF2_GEOBA|nr:hypothetical protein GBAR_LOCUS11745 [Geodia barretti]
MSASMYSPTSRSSWRSHQLGIGGGQIFDPSQSYPYTYSVGGFSALDASTFSIQPVTQNGTLTQQLVERGLSELGRTGDGTGVTFLTLTLKVSPNVYIC